MLLERVPTGHMTALERSPSMIDQARRRIGDDPVWS
jgi:trans-aconitate methyltransferase